MKKIISGKVYDTDTAALKGEYSNGGNWRDFNHLEESLYLKRTGEFFLHGEGGPLTKYSERVDGNSWSGGSQIIPLSFREAREWAEEHLNADQYEGIFGKVEEDDSKVLTAFNLTRTAVEKLKREAQERGMTQSALIEEKLR